MFLVSARTLEKKLQWGPSTRCDYRLTAHIQVVRAGETRRNGQGTWKEARGGCVGSGSTGKEEGVTRDGGGGRGGYSFVTWHIISSTDRAF